MQKEVNHPIVITSNRQTIEKTEWGLRPGELLFISGTSGIMPPISYTYKRRKSFIEHPCPGCEFEKKK